MARTPRTWDPLDKAMADHFATLRDNTRPRPPYRLIGEAIGASYNRAMQLLDKQGGPPTLHEFRQLCHFFHLKPSKLLNDLEKQTATTPHPQPPANQR